MLSTLLLLVLSGLVLQSIISISTNYIVQLNQLSSTYQAEAALNMSEKILTDYLVEHPTDAPTSVNLSSSVGKIRLTKHSPTEYEGVITQKNGVVLQKKITIQENETAIEETETEEKEIEETEIQSFSEEESTVIE